MKIEIDTDKMSEVGENLLAAVESGKLILVLDTQYQGDLSSSGKMRTVASTSGFALLPGSLKGNVYIGKKAGNVQQK